MPPSALLTCAPPPPTTRSHPPADLLPPRCRVHANRSAPERLFSAEVKRVRLRCVNRRPSLAPPSASAAAAPNRRARRTTASATRRARCGLPFACVGSTAHGLPQRGCCALAGLHVVVQMHQLPKPPRRPRRRAYDAPHLPPCPNPSDQHAWTHFRWRVQARSRGNRKGRSTCTHSLLPREVFMAGRTVAPEA